MVNAVWGSSRSFAFKWLVRLEQSFFHRFSPKMYNSVGKVFCYLSIKEPNLEDEYQNSNVFSSLNEISTFFYIHTERFPKKGLN